MWSEVNFWMCLLLFGTYFAFDVVYSQYIIAIQKLNAATAGILSVIIGTVSAVGIIKLADNPLYSVPVVLGGGLGTYFIIKWEAKRKKKEVKK